MRDYSIQHISHLVADGQVGKEGVAVIQSALESDNPMFSSTALIALHRLSETRPDLIQADTVQGYARQSEDSSDERLQATAIAILKEANQ